MQPLISIVVPVYNHAEALKHALDSITAQTYKNREIIVVDDGSDVPIEHSDEYHLLTQKNSGAPAARNKGLQAAKGEYVIFWDADVIAKPSFLQKLFSALQQHPEASYAYSNMSFGTHKMPAQEFSPDALKKNNYIHSTSLIRRSKAVLWDETLKRFQDWDLWLTMLKQGKKGVWVDEYLFTVTPHNEGMSSWLPSFAYKKPWKWLPWIRGKVQKYESAKEVVMRKHDL